MRTTDNNCGVSLNSIIDKEKEEIIDKKTIIDLKHIAKINFNNIKTEHNPNLLIFPNENDIKPDNKFKQKKIFSLYKHNKDYKIKTGNILGFVGRRNTNLNITSRFSSNDNQDNFLLYMLSKILCLNIVDYKINSGKDGILDLIILLFPDLLNKALSQGLYKEYKRNEYNDANVKGIIDVKRHLRVNLPFAGKVAYTTREYSYDNPVMQIIRHTIEYIKTHPLCNILYNDTKNDTVKNIHQIMQETPNYNKNERQKILNINKKKKVVHPYFTEYKELQKLCISILSYEKTSTGNESEKIHGILFRGDWLWEEYVNIILEELGFEHKESNKKEGYKFFHEDKDNKKTGKICPDFLIKKKIIADAKFKPLEEGVDNHDYFQILSYMLRFDAKKGCLIFPHENEEYKKFKTLLNSRDQRSDYKVALFGFPVPQGISNFDEFSKSMKNSEELLRANLKNFIN